MWRTWAVRCLTCEQVELVVELQQLEGAPRSPALLFGQTVVDVPLVLGGATHPDPLMRHRTSNAPTTVLLVSLFIQGFADMKC